MGIPEQAVESAVNLSDGLAYLISDKTVYQVDTSALQVRLNGRNFFYTSSTHCLTVLLHFTGCLDISHTKSLRLSGTTDDQETGGPSIWPQFPPGN